MNLQTPVGQRVPNSGHGLWLVDEYRRRHFLLFGSRMRSALARLFIIHPSHIVSAGVPDASDRPLDETIIAC
ncbi:hypothetical protein IZV00_15170 [Sphingobium sp. Cam5-1]|nr:hypothetical protein IZV00_15170 [Sphingobium sp. Cam5-1]